MISILQIRYISFIAFWSYRSFLIQCSSIFAIVTIKKLVVSNTHAYFGNLRNFFFHQKYFQMKCIQRLHQHQHFHPQLLHQDRLQHLGPWSPSLLLPLPNPMVSHKLSIITYKPYSFKMISWHILSLVSPTGIQLVRMVRMQRHMWYWNTWTNKFEQSFRRHNQAGFLSDYWLALLPNRIKVNLGQSEPDARASFRKPIKV